MSHNHHFRLLGLWPLGEQTTEFLVLPRSGQSWRTNKSVKFNYKIQIYKEEIIGSLLQIGVAFCRNVIVNSVACFIKMENGKSCKQDNSIEQITLVC